MSQHSNSSGTIARYIDHTLLKADASYAQIEQLCAEALRYQFASVCVTPCHVKRCANILKDNPVVKVCTVIGFPLGANTTVVKVEETKQAISEGATEVDMVINIGALKSGDWSLVESDIQAVVQAAHNGGAIVKVILETCLLTTNEKERACAVCKTVGADFVKTSTGFSTGGATADDISLMRHAVGPDMGVKASGGVRTLAGANAMITAGASRIGASAGVKIVHEEQSKSSKSATNKTDETTSGGGSSEY